MFRRIWISLLIATIGVAGFPPTSGVTQSSRRNVEIDLLVQGGTFQEREDDDTCRTTDALGEPELVFGTQRFPLGSGTPLKVKDSPTGRFGCMFELTADLDGSNSYEVRVGKKVIGSITADTIASLDYMLEISIGATEETQSGETWRFPPRPTPLPTATKIPSPTAVPTPQLGAVEGSGTFRVGGSFVLIGSDGTDYSILSGACVGRGGYSDIGPGTQVIVKNEAGSIIAVGVLEPDPNALKGLCQFVFYIEVPEAKFYSFGVSHRGELVYSHQDLMDRGWIVTLSLG